MLVKRQADAGKWIRVQVDITSSDWTRSWYKDTPANKSYETEQIQLLVNDRNSQKLRSQRKEEHIICKECLLLFTSEFSFRMLLPT